MPFIVFFLLCCLIADIYLFLYVAGCSVIVLIGVWIEKNAMKKISTATLNWNLDFSGLLLSTRHYFYVFLQADNDHPTAGCFQYPATFFNYKNYF